MASRAAGNIALRAAAASLTLSSCYRSSESVAIGSFHRFESSSARRHYPSATSLTSSSAAATGPATFSSSALAMASPLPQRPLRYLSGGDDGREFRPPLDLKGLDQTIAATEGRREEAFALSRKINMCLARRRFRLERGKEEGEGEGGVEDGSSDAQLKSLMSEVLQKGTEDKNEGSAAVDSGGNGEGGNPNNRAPRDANLSSRVEDYVRLLAYEHFLSTGSLLPPSSVPSAVTDEEYLGGACIGLSRDLERYGVGRATVRDAASVRLARDLVGDVMDQLLLFDFRNGPLRRKYDGTKYALRTLETVLYELSVTGTSAEEEGKGSDGDGDSSAEPDLKKMRMEGSSAEEDAMDEDRKEGDVQAGGEGDGEGEGEPSPPKEERIPTAQIESLRRRMEHRDDLRERLIKRCRDGQKAAKQAIYALHRGDIGRAKRLLAQCEDCVKKDLLPIVEEEPGLRYGSFANVMEEYAEARLFYAWLVGGEEKEGDSGGGGGTKTAPTKVVDKPAAVILQPVDFPLHLEPAEYLGGLCDLTGEVGRFAVQRGTARDSDGVRICLETNMSILHALETLDRFPSRSDIGKKMGPLRNSVQKLERMLYEMSLVEATGGKRNVAVESAHVHDGEKDDDD